MVIFKKLIGFMSVFALIPVGFAATITPTARPSIITTASARMPTMTTQINGSTSSSSSSATTNAILADKECIDTYTDCAKGADVCGSGFEECTNKTLFYGKKPQCSSLLMTCKTTAITSLFGISTTASFANKNAAGEFIYPTDGSVLGQLISAAHINNRYDTSNCVKKYTSCLKKDDVCGADFELCTSNTEFKKQNLFCESTLARCQDDGKKQLFGTTVSGANPTGDSRLGIMITEGAALAAVNSVSTCYKVVDQCFLNTCATNPYKCKEGSNKDVVNIVETINNPDGSVKTTTTENILGAVNRNEISGFIKNNCADTIGANKYCYATFLGNGAMPTNAQLRDEDNRDSIYAEAYSSRMNESMRSKINDLITKFDIKTQKRCSDTIVACAMRSCGGGSGAACYSSAFNSSNTIKGVTNPATLLDIKSGCEAVVNNDTSCKYAGATFQNTTGVLNFLETSLFDDLFTSADSTDASKPDAVGAVATLNSKLSLSYNQGALDQMKRQCQTVATGCVKTMCGTDYANCYRNRTDVYGTLTDSGDAKFDKSMNKVGGVLDHTIVLGLCLNTVKNNPACEEHIKAESARRTASVSTANSWGAGIDNTRDGWLDAGVFSATSAGNVQDADADGNLMCTTSSNNDGNAGRCDDASGTYIYPKTVSESAYNIAQAERTVFRDLVYDLEVEAQAKYNAKLTKQQNMCLSGNTGGIIGAKDNGSTFMWVKLKNGKVPNGYAVSGLKTDQFVSSNEIYNSFCRVRVNLQSSDKKIQDAISSGKTWSSANFAAGDTFTCGSWIPNSELEAISASIGSEAEKEARRGDGRTSFWTTLGGIAVGGVGGGIATNALQKSGGLGGLLGTNNTSGTVLSDDAQNCLKNIDLYKAQPDGATAKPLADAAITFANKAKPGSAEAQLAAAAAAAAADAAKKTDANAKMDSLAAVCRSSAKASKPEAKMGTNLIGAGAGALIGGLLVNKATNDLQNSSAEGANKDAREKWMNDIGSKIRCFIGSDEVGMYSDIISTEME